MSDNRHFFLKLAHTGARVSPVWWAVIMAIVIMIGGQMVGRNIFDVFLISGLFGDPDSILAEPEIMQNLSAKFNSWQQGFVLALLTIGPIIGVFLWTAHYEKRSIGSLGFFHLSGGVIKFIRGGIFAVAIMALMAFGMKAVGYAEVSEAAVPDSWLQLWPLLVLLLGWCIQGSSEEIVFRGLLFQSVAARHNLLLGLAVSSALFSLAHGFNSNPTPLFFVNLVAYSLFACFYALREGGLWGICGFHALWNFAQGNLFGFAVSGEQFGADRWMSFQETGPDLITGGATGPEGGLVTMAALALSTALLFLISPPKDFPYAETASPPNS